MTKGSIAKGKLIRKASKSLLSTPHVDKVEAMLGSYGADPNPRVTEVINDDFPSGMVARGTYKVTSKVIDLDGKEWLRTSTCGLTRTHIDNHPTSRLGLAAQDFQGVVNPNYGFVDVVNIM